MIHLAPSPSSTKRISGKGEIFESLVDFCSLIVELAPPCSTKPTNKHSSDSRANMSRFFHGGSDSESSSSDEEELYSDREEEEVSDEEETTSEEESSEEESSDDEGGVTGAKKFMRDAEQSDESEEEDRVTIVKSAKDKRLEELEGTLKLIDNAEKINDWAVISTGAIPDCLALGLTMCLVGC